VRHAQRGVGAGEVLVQVVSCWCSTEGGHGISSQGSVLVPTGACGGLWAVPLGDVGDMAPTSEAHIVVAWVQRG
jgi:hypothetical protein